MSKGMMKSWLLSLIICLGVALSLCATETLAQTPNQTTRPRQATTTPPATPPPAPVAEATVTLNEQFLNALLEAMFTRLGRPSFPLSLAGAERPGVKTPTGVEPPANSRAAASTSQCASVVVLEREMDGVKTAVHFENGRIVAPLAFSGSYSVVLLGCMRFQGWAETVINLNFDRERQVLSARVDVQDIHLGGIPSLANGVIINLVQGSLDSRINPVEILQAAQLTTRLPITAAGGALRLRAREVRPEILPGSLRLHIFYEFASDK